jgi:uncharacterized protein
MNPSTQAKTCAPHEPAFLAYQHEFTHYLRQPEQESLTQSLPANIGIYARLLYSKFDGSLSTCFPISKTVLGEEKWQQLVRSFIREHRCQSPLYREIPDEFIEFLINTPQPDLPEFLVDLAHFEWIELVLETANPKPTLDLDGMEKTGDILEDIPVLNPVLHILRYRYPVHIFTLENQAWLKPEDNDTGQEQPVILVGLRDKAYRIDFLEINAITARLIELLQEGFRTGRSALMQLAVELKQPTPESLIPFGEVILDQLVSQHIIQGVKHEI